MNPRAVETLMADIEQEDPLDLGELSLDERDVRRMMATHFCDIDARLCGHGLTPEARLEIMAAIAAHTMVENLVLHFDRLRRVASKSDFRDWMRRHGMQ